MVSEQEMNEVVTKVRQMNMGQLRELSEYVHEYWGIRKRQLVREFSPMDKVSFKLKTGQVVEAVVDKVNRTTVSIIGTSDPINDRRYRVHPGILTKI
jgi:hypothetical protein